MEAQNSSASFWRNRHRLFCFFRGGGGGVPSRMCLRRQIRLWAATLPVSAAAEWSSKPAQALPKSRLLDARGSLPEICGWLRASRYKFPLRVCWSGWCASFPAEEETVQRLGGGGVMSSSTLPYYVCPHACVSDPSRPEGGRFGWWGQERSHGALPSAPRQPLALTLLPDSNN